MTKTNLTAFAILCMVAAVSTGCCSGMKATFINELDKTIEPNYRTSGVGNFRVVVGKLKPGQEKTVCVKLDPRVLPAKFTVTIFEGTGDSLQAIPLIPEEYPEEITVMFLPGEDVDVVIKIVDQDGNDMLKR